MKTLNVPPETGEDTDMIAVWSMGESLLAWDGAAIDGPAKIAYKMHWGEETQVVEVENPTYRDLYVAANKLIVDSGDDHHVFIEDIVYVPEEDIWELYTGS